MQSYCYLLLTHFNTVRLLLPNEKSHIITDCFRLTPLELSEIRPVQARMHDTSKREGHKKDYRRLDVNLFCVRMYRMCDAFARFRSNVFFFFFNAFFWGVSTQLIFLMVFISAAGLYHRCIVFECNVLTLLCFGRLVRLVPLFASVQCVRGLRPLIQTLPMRREICR